MTTLSRHAIVGYTPAQMYRLVNDIDLYPQFLPWCRDSQIIDKNEVEIIASISIAKGPLQHSFTTRNVLQHNESMEMTLINGPFKRLYGRWQFIPHDGEHGCHIKLEIDFEFSSKLIGIALDPIFTQIASSLVDAFCQRASQLYGHNSD